jgi:cytochrome c oxidase cbb3-type subunit 4
MAIEQVFDVASSVMTVASFATFIGILLWTFVIKGGADFDAAAALPFADADADGDVSAPPARKVKNNQDNQESRHG